MKASLVGSCPRTQALARSTSIWFEKLGGTKQTDGGKIQSQRNSFSGSKVRKCNLTPNIFFLRGPNLSFLPREGLRCKNISGTDINFDMLASILMAKAKNCNSYKLSMCTCQQTLLVSRLGQRTNRTWAEVSLWYVFYSSISLSSSLMVEYLEACPRKGGRWEWNQGFGSQ